MTNLVKMIMNEPEIKDKPPVLLDIGASEAIHPKWKKLAKYSICIAFDADERDFQFMGKKQTSFKKLYVYNSLALDKDEDRVKFYLTKSPYCSSTLEPDLEKLKPYIHSNLFETDKIVELKATSIYNVLNKLSIEHIDWFKTDSQGIDLRLFKSLSGQIRNKIIIAEFEPGIINAYKGEDQFYSILEYLTSSEFWLSDIKIKGVPRLPRELLDSNFKGETYKKLVKESMKKAPSWGEMTFINKFESATLGVREYLLGWLFSTLEHHDSFAFVLATEGSSKFKKEIFNDLRKISFNRIRRDVIKLKFLPSIAEKIKKSFFS
jgi:hypothetical protein